MNREQVIRTKDELHLTLLLRIILVTILQRTIILHPVVATCCIEATYFSISLRQHLMKMRTTR